MGIEEPPEGVIFHCGKFSHLGKKKMPFSQMLRVYCQNWKIGQKEGDCQTLPNQGKTVLQKVPV